MRYRVLVRNNDFVRAYSKGKSYVCAQLVMYVNKNRVGKTRVGITTGKKIGNAVTRNRARRVIREALYASLPLEVGGVDLVFVARAATPTCKSWQVAACVKKLLLKAGLACND